MTDAKGWHCLELRRGSKRLIRDLNLSAVLNLIRRYEPLSRVDIAQRTRLGKSTVTGIINTLLREGLISEVGSAQAGVGRRPILLSINAESRCVIGIKLAPLGVSIALTDLHARLLQAVERPLPPAPGAELVLQTLESGVAEVIARQGVDRGNVIGAGLVLPGIVDQRTGISLSSYLLGWENIPVRAVLEERIGMPVFVDNDANAFTLAEHWFGAGRGAEHMLGVTIGIGIGAGIIIGGELYRGRMGAGELGHITVNENGPQCACGNRGCLEAMAADGAIVRAAWEALKEAPGSAMAPPGGDPAAITRERVVDAAVGGDRIARLVLDQIGRHLGVGLANTVNLLHPHRIVLGGEAVMQAGELLLAPIRHALRLHAFSTLADDVTVVPATLGAGAWLMGAATLVLDEVFKPPVYAATADQPQVNLARQI